MLAVEIVHWTDEAQRGEVLVLATSLAMSECGAARALTGAAPEPREACQEGL